MAASSTDAKLAEVIERVFRMTLTAPGDDTASASARGDRSLYPECSRRSHRGGRGAAVRGEPRSARARPLARSRRPRTSQSWSSTPRRPPCGGSCAATCAPDRRRGKTRSRDEAYAEARRRAYGRELRVRTSASAQPRDARDVLQPPEAELRGALQLYDELSMSPRARPGFLEGPARATATTTPPRSRRRSNRSSPSSRTASARPPSWASTSNP